jgi:hypothetical protein
MSLFAFVGWPLRFTELAYDEEIQCAALLCVVMTVSPEPPVFDVLADEEVRHFWVERLEGDYWVCFKIYDPFVCRCTQSSDKPEHASAQIFGRINLNARLGIA